MAAQKVPFFVPFIDEEENHAVIEAIRSHWLTTGPRCVEFEAALAAYLGGDVHVVSVNSATAGLHLALEAIGIGPGDEVLVPTLTFTATAEVVRYLGASAVLVDVDPETLGMDFDAAALKVTPATKAVMPVHFAGLPISTVQLECFAADHDLKVVEDAAHALSASAGGIRIGRSNSAAIVFSFYANKTITTGEGGAIATRDGNLAQRMRVMRTHGIDRDASARFSGGSWEYDVIAPGYKYNLTDIAAALGIVQLRKADRARDLRSAMAKEYIASLADLPLKLPNSGDKSVVHAWHIFPVALTDDAALGRDEVIEKLREAGIGTSVHYRPLHRMTYWAETSVRVGETFPVADRHFDRTLTLPLFPGMSSAEQGYVIQTLRSILEQ